MRLKQIAFTALLSLSAHEVLSQTTTSFSAIENIMVDQGDPDLNFKGQTFLFVDADSWDDGTNYKAKSYLKFDLTSLAGQTIQSAILRVVVINPSLGTQSVFRVSGSWNASTVTYNTQPVVDPAISAIQVKNGNRTGVFEQDITPLCIDRAGSICSIGFDTSSTDGLAFNSMEAATGQPMLIVTCSPPPTSTYTWTLGSDVATPKFTTLDLDPLIIKEPNGDLWFQYTTGGTGTQAVHRWKGTNMDDLVQQPNAIKDSSFGRPYGDDKYWLGPGWRDPSTGKWYSTVHVEFHYYDADGNPGTWDDKTWYRRLGLATSTNHGETWHWEGDIITSDSPYTHAQYSGAYFNTGQGDQKLFYDDSYFYLYSRNDWMAKTNWPDRVSNMVVSRCPIASKMAPGSWQKWHNGAWTQPGLGGHESPIFRDVDSAVVFYSNYLHRYLTIAYALNETALIYDATNLDLNDWSEPGAFSDISRIKWYNFPIDPVTLDRYILPDNVFRFYSSDVGYSGPTKFMEVELFEGASLSN